MQELIDKVDRLKRSSIRKTVDKRLKEFSQKKTKEELFKELCFCILAANYNAERSWNIQRELDNELLTLPEQQLAVRLKKHGHRFPPTRASYIVEARKHLDALVTLPDDHTAREWLVENVKGIGYKEASHFLRNIGRKNFAIIDFHILDILEKCKLAEKPKTLTKKRYLEIESVLKQLSEKSGLSLAELDLYLWFTETGKVLK